MMPAVHQLVVCCFTTCYIADFLSQLPWVVLLNCPSCYLSLLSTSIKHKCDH